MRIKTNYNYFFSLLMDKRSSLFRFTHLVLKKTYFNIARGANDENQKLTSIIFSISLSTNTLAYFTPHLLLKKFLTHTRGANDENQKLTTIIFSIYGQTL